jgi:hypothetical protein
VVDQQLCLAADRLLVRTSVRMTLEAPANDLPISCAIAAETVSRFYTKSLRRD